jgi:hypothetical protein
MTKNLSNRACFGPERSDWASQLSWKPDQTSPENNVGGGRLIAITVDPSPQVRFGPFSLKSSPFMPSLHGGPPKQIQSTVTCNVLLAPCLLLSRSFSEDRTLTASKPNAQRRRSLPPSAGPFHRPAPHASDEETQYGARKVRLRTSGQGAAPWAAPAHGSAP